MKIAVLGWGSLIWDQQSLKIQNDRWYEDGPSLPIEFARISLGNRLTLVIKPYFDPVTVYHATSVFSSLTDARENLRIRESTPNDSNIGFYNFQTGENSIRRIPELITEQLLQWNRLKDYDAVIWTDLGPNFSDKRNVRFTLLNIRSFFEELNPADYAEAKKYVSNAPIQIQTRFRPGIEEILATLTEQGNDTAQP